MSHRRSCPRLMPVPFSRLMRLMLLVLAAAGLVAAAQPVALHEVFPYEAVLTVEGPGLSRLELPPQVLERCRSDLSDLRIFDPACNEVPYLVDTRPDGAAVQVQHRVEPQVVAYDRHREGEQYGPTRYREITIIEVPALPDKARSWELVVDSSRQELVARIDLVAVGFDGERSPLLEGGSLFRLQSPPAEHRRFALAVQGPVRLELTLTSEDAGYLEPFFYLEALRSIRSPHAPAIVLEQLEQRQLFGRTEVVLERPRGIVPSRLRLRTTTGSFHRRVEVWDEGSGADASPLGSAELLRIDAFVPVEVSELRLRPASGDRLRLVIENHDSPPLEQIEVAAEVPQPVLFFSLPDGTNRATLRFGGARTHRPDYDLAALRPALGGTIEGEQPVSTALAFWDPARSQQAQLGAIEENPDYDPAPALAFAMHPGAVLSPQPFSHRRLLSLTPSPEGLSRLRLQPADLACLRPDLADLRVIDEQSRQWAYLLVQGSGSTMAPLPVSRHRSERGSSHYSFELPVQPLLLDRVVLEPAAPFFDRAFRLLATPVDGRQQQLAAGRLVRHHGDPRPVTIAVGRQRLKELELVIEDGDDAPLELARVAARVPLPDLYLPATDGSYTLLLGNPGSAPPRYELARVRATVLGVPAAVADAGALEKNPDLSLGARLAGHSRQQLLLWIVLALAVAALTGLTLRLARQEKVE